MVVERNHLSVPHKEMVADTNAPRLCYTAIKGDMKATPRCHKEVILHPKSPILIHVDALLLQLKENTSFLMKISVNSRGFLGILHI